MLVMIHYQVMARPSAPPTDALGLLLRRRLNEVGKSQNALARHIGRSQGWVSQYLFGESEQTLRRLAGEAPARLVGLLNFLEWTPEQFMREATKIGVDIVDIKGIVENLAPLRPSDALPVRRYRIPIVDAGAGLPAWNEGGEFIVLDLPELRGKPESELFAVRVIGDSMSPTYLNGDVVVCWTEGQPEPGRVVAVHQHGDGLILKRLQYSGNQAMLYSDNPAYPPMPIGEHDRIYGVVLGMWRPAK